MIWEREHCCTDLSIQFSQEGRVRGKLFSFETGGASTANKGVAPMQLGVVGKTQDEVTSAHVCVIKRGSYGFSAKGGGFLEEPSRFFSE